MVRRVSATAFRLCAVAPVVVLVLAGSGCSAGSPAGRGTGTHSPAGGARSGGGPEPAASVRLSVRTLPVTLPVALRDVVVFPDGAGLLVAGGLTAAGTTTAAMVR